MVELTTCSSLLDSGVMSGSHLTLVQLPPLQVVTAVQNATAKIWKGASGECEHTLQGHRGPVLSAAFSPDGQRVATASADCSAMIWKAASGECELTLKGH